MTNGLAAISNLLPIIHKLVDKKYSANITSEGDECRVILMRKRATLFFYDKDVNELRHRLEEFAKVC